MPHQPKYLDGEFDAIDDIPQALKLKHNPVTGRWTERDTGTGRFMDQKADSKPLKGVRKERWPRPPTLTPSQAPQDPS